jgi:pyridoxal phosphate enzyme (YggS family)
MSILKPGLAERYERVKQSLTDDESRCGRKPGSVFLLPVSKTFGIEALEAVKCGMRTFGENYVQEGCEKIEYFKKMHPELAITWHFIGHLQSNKTRPVAEHFDWVQTVDRLKIAQRLSEQRPADMPPLNVLIEVHISDEESKSGCQPADVPALAQAITLLPNLKLRGIMAIPAPSDNEEGKKAPLKEMHAIFLHLRDELNFDIDTLSMGMSADMAEAVECGSTMVRVGSAIFGPRDYTKKE